MLKFLETLPDPSETVRDMVRRYRAEVVAWEKFHDPLKGFSSGAALRAWEIQG